MSRANNPHVVIHGPTGTRVEFPNLAAADSYAVRVSKGRPGEFVYYDLTVPHVAVDSRDRGDMAFDTEAKARGYIETANAHHGFERYSYLFVG